MASSERNEIIQLNGTTMVVALALVANFLIVGFIYRWHHWQVFAAEKRAQQEYSRLLKEEHALKQDILTTEGASTWASTSFQRIRPLTDSPEL
jgi:hypothetical protein